MIYHVDYNGSTWAYELEPHVEDGISFPQYDPYLLEKGEYFLSSCQLYDTGGLPLWECITNYLILILIPAHTKEEATRILEKKFNPRQVYQVNACKFDVC